MAYTGQTAGIHAAAQANDVELSMALELDYARYSGRALYRLRFTGETFREQLQRLRPPEITGRGEVCQAFTTQISVSGTLSGAFSIGGYDTLLAAVLGGMPRNGVVQNGLYSRSWTICAKIGSQWITRRGCYCTKVQIDLAQGRYAQIACDFTCSEQVIEAVDPASLRLDAPVGAVLDTVGNFGGLTLDGVGVDGTVRGLSLTLNRDGAAAEYGLGRASPCGQQSGEIEATGTVQIFFQSYALYQRYRRGLGGEIAVSVNDGAGSTYVFTFLNGVLLNPRVNAGSRNTSIVASFDIEGNPRPEGGTFTVTRRSDPLAGLGVGGLPLSFQGQAIRP